MPGKPFQSKLRKYEKDISILYDKGCSYRGIAKELNKKYHLNITHNAVFSFIKTRSPGRRGKRLFFEGLLPDIREALLKQITAVWTHDSTAIEGNTLTLGETVKVLELGLTISGKSLRDHQEVYGHARAIDLIYRMIRADEIREKELFDLHRAVMDKSAVDVTNPVGDWKQDFNGTTGVINGKSVYMEYAKPGDVPHLMERWLLSFNKMLEKALKPSAAISAYTWAHISLVRIHPFFDGNGRVARLVANIPVIRSGYPPIVVPSEKRSEYIDLLWEYQNAVGRINRASRLLPAHPAIKRFEGMLKDQWQVTVALVEDARRRNAARADSSLLPLPL